MKMMRFEAYGGSVSSATRINRLPQAAAGAKAHW